MTYSIRVASAQFNSIKLSVVILKQGKSFVAYSPALDLSTSGKNLKEARKRFGETVNMFFEELDKKGTLEEVLQDLGWEKVKKGWNPPKIVSETSFDIRVPVAA